MYKQKLIDLLKSDKQTKQAMEKLQFCCKIKYDTDEYIFLSYTDNSLDTLRLLNNDLGIEEIEEKYSFEIIGLPLQERFIRMYCKGKYICFHGEKELNIGIYQIQLDNTKDFDNQSEETYMDIFNALIDIK